jgi:OOP family OmpA-OmpF porin
MILMKQVVLLLAALAAAPAFAQNAYVSGAVGQSVYSMSIDGESGNDSAGGFTAAVGYRFTPTYSIEGGYAAFGKISDSDGFDSAEIDADAVYGALVGTFPLTPNFSLTGKVGVARGNTKMAVRSGSASATLKFHQTGLMAGFGAAYAFTPKVALITEFQHFGKVMNEDGFSIKASMVSIGARFSF